MKKRTSEVDKLQKEWGNKPCLHNKGYGHEVDDETSCDCDCFCMICGMRHADSQYFIDKISGKEEAK